MFGSHFFTGINYWESQSAIDMWSRFDPEAIENDMRLLRGAGITHLRVFPLWPVFQPLHALYASKVYEYSFGEDPLPDTPAGRAGVSEEACGNFEKFCQLAEKYEMKLIVGLITGQMSFRIYAPPALEGKDLLGDPTVLKWQLRFVKYFVERFKTQNAIVGWDLGNETRFLSNLENKPIDTFYVWCSLIADAIKLSDPTRPVISGLAGASIEKDYASLKTIGEMCDIHTVHPYVIFSLPSDPLPTMRPILDVAFQNRFAEDIAGIPVFVQEFGSIGYMTCSKKSEADFYRAALFACFSHGCHGAMWWCAFDQGHLNSAPYRWNAIGSDYGFFDKDLNEKPIVCENRAFKDVLKLFPDGLPCHRTDAVVLAPREEVSGFELYRTAFLLAKQANFDVRFQYALDPISDAPLYILPSLRGIKAVPKNRLDELMRKVEAGAVLYLCADKGLFRQIPEITGVEVEYREKVGEVKTLKFGKSELPIHTTYFYKPEQWTAEVLAADEDGEPVFFKHAYGKGFVYFLTLPLEAYLTDKAGAFHREEVPDYSVVYRELAAAAGIRRVCDSDNRFVRLTEHPIDENALYVIAINYHNKPARAKLTIEHGYRVTALYGAIDENTVSIRQNDAVILKLERN